MRSGELRHFIEFQADTGGTTNAYGEVQPAWETYATAYAAIVPQDASESVEGGQPTASVRYRIKCRHVEGVKPTHQIVYGDRAFEIIGVMDLQERGRELRIEAMERIDG